ncbi:MAG: amidohydrolase family protein [Ilumatobacter sp.]
MALIGAWGGHRDDERLVTGSIPGRGPVAVSVAGSRISRVEPIESEGAVTLIPGLLDLQVNGYGGIDLNDGAVTPERLADLIRALRSVGVTGFCPTFVTAPVHELVASLRSVAALMEDEPHLAHSVLGVHLEGPWISARDGARGAHAARHVRPATLAELDLLTQTGAPISIITVAPEAAGVIDLIPEVVRRGIVVSIGHSAADPSTIAAAVEAGATMSTHLGNGVAAELPRHPNLIWSQLASDALWASFIADGHHVDSEPMSVFLKAKGLDRSLLVSDTVAIAGLAAGTYESSIGDVVELSDSGRLSLAGTSYLAGAVRTLLDGVAWLVDSHILGHSDAVRLATANPAALLGARVADRGRIGVGCVADLVRVDFSGARPRVLEVIVGGVTVSGVAT